MKEMLLESQVSNMEEVLKENSIESDFKRNELYKNYLWHIAFSSNMTTYIRSDIFWSKPLLTLSFLL